MKMRKLDQILEQCLEELELKESTLDLDKLDKLCEDAISEGAGAAVTFHFDEKDRDYNIDVEFEGNGLEVNVKNLLVTDYYHSQLADDGGKFIFDENTLKEAAVKEINDYDTTAEEITVEDIDKIEITGVYEMPNLSCSWGWVRSDIPEEMTITESSNGYYAVLELDVTVNGENSLQQVEVDGKYIPSEDVKNAYGNLDLEEDDWEEEE